MESQRVGHNLAAEQQPQPLATSWMNQLQLLSRSVSSVKTLESITNSWRVFFCFRRALGNAECWVHLSNQEIERFNGECGDCPNGAPSFNESPFQLTDTGLIRDPSGAQIRRKGWSDVALLSPRDACLFGSWQPRSRDLCPGPIQLQRGFVLCVQRLGTAAPRVCRSCVDLRVPDHKQATGPVGTRYDRTRLDHV